MEIKLKGKVMPRNAAGDAHFVYLESEQTDNDEGEVSIVEGSVRSVFTAQEVVELVNRALYQLEYQAAAHRKRGQAERDKMKKLKEELKKAGKDVKATLVERELKGE